MDQPLRTSMSSALWSGSSPKVYILVLDCSLFSCDLLCDSFYSEEMSVVVCPGCPSRVEDAITADANACFLSPRKKREETAVWPECLSHLTQGEMASQKDSSKASLVGYLTAGLHLLLLIFGIRFTWKSHSGHLKKFHCSVIRNAAFSTSLRTCNNPPPHPPWSPEWQSSSII